MSIDYYTSVFGRYELGSDDARLYGLLGGTFGQVEVEGPADRYVDDTEARPWLSTAGAGIRILRSATSDATRRALCGARS